MPDYTQAYRSLEVVTPLGDDVLLLVGLTGQEGISQLFSFQLELIAKNESEVAFDKLLGQKITVRLSMPGDRVRYFNGVCARVSEGGRGRYFTSYHMDIVPQFWLLGRKSQSRIFQEMSVTDILKKVLEGMDVEYGFQGKYEPRIFCVQYRETDFNFASRLMEEEGIYYFFKHQTDKHIMVLSDTPKTHPEVPEGSELIFDMIEGGLREEGRVYAWEKAQELRSGKVTLRDYNFGLPQNRLPVDQTVMTSVQVGEVQHKLKVGGNDTLEIYDYPGGYARRFDSEQVGSKVFQDNKRTVAIRMQQQEASSLNVRGASTCRNLVSGHKLKLLGHFNADGEYLLTSVQHACSLGDNFRSGGEEEFSYDNTFTCIPLSLPFRPLQVTPKPVVKGTQTAVVVGPPGEEIHTDKYGRIKVLFHWDREGDANEKASCWIRVATPWAGSGWGTVHIPRVGHEVVVDFLEGDPDQPIVIGSVYNALQLPANKLPDAKNISGIKSNSTLGGGGYNELSMDDTKGKEKITIHAQFDINTRVENDFIEEVVNDYHETIGGNKFEQVTGDSHLLVKGDDNYKTEGTYSIEAGADIQKKVGANYALDAASEIHLKAGKNLVIESGQGLTLKVGGSFIVLAPGQLDIKGTKVNINSGGSPGSGAGASPTAPTAPKKPPTGEAGKMVTPEATPSPPPKATFFGMQAKALKGAAERGDAFCEKCEEARKEREGG